LGDFDFAGEVAGRRVCFTLFFNASIRLIVAGSSSYSSGAAEMPPLFITRLQSGLLRILLRWPLRKHRHLPFARTILFFQPLHGRLDLPR